MRGDCVLKEENAGLRPFLFSTLGKVNKEEEKNFRGSLFWVRGGRDVNANCQ